MAGFHKHAPWSMVTVDRHGRRRRSRAGRKGAFWSALTCASAVAALAGLSGCGEMSTAANPASAPQQAASEPSTGRTETVDLGETILRQTRPLENSTLNVRFKAHAVAADENAERLQRILATRKHQAREQIVVAVRTAETWEFDEPELIRLRRRIQFRFNRWLDAPLVEDVVLTDFRFRVD